MPEETLSLSQLCETIEKMFVDVPIQRTLSVVNDLVSHVNASPEQAQAAIHQLVHQRRLERDESGILRLPSH